MDAVLIRGGAPLSGTVAVGGAKNAALPMMATALLADEPVTLSAVPRLADVRTLARVLRRLGVDVHRASGGNLHLETIDCRPVRADYELVRRMRASFCVLGPLLARRGRAIVSLPGGCNLGPRPVDLHLRGLSALGAEVRIERGYVVARAKRLRGAKIDMLGPNGPTVTGTANVLSAAVLARGKTVLNGTATEPEIVNLGHLLIEMGARIEGLGTSTLVVHGVETLGGAAQRVIPDRIEAATLLAAAVATGGDVCVSGVIPQHLAAVLATLAELGVPFSVGANRVSVRRSAWLQPITATARPYPGLPTDVQPLLAPLLALANGTSRIDDAVFPRRFSHAAELTRMGANIGVRGDALIIRGKTPLTGAEITAPDLRAAAGLIIAGLAARGTTIVRGLKHLDRGYERLDRKLAELGANIQRIETSSREFVFRASA